VDTIRQLYRGTPRADFLAALDEALSSGGGHLVGGPMGWGWHVRKMGKASGYRYSLQNRDQGVIVLVGSYYAALDRDGAHCKIELSPGAIAVRGHQQITELLNTVAAEVLGVSKPSGVAVHLAMDVQGWQPPSDLRERFVTRAKRVVSFQAPDSATFQGLDNLAVHYGEDRGWLFGAASALQLAIYNKSVEIVKSDKEDYFRDAWGAYTFGQWDQEATVWRVESRCHHNVVRELGLSLGQVVEQWKDVYPLLGDLWAYALRANRLEEDGEISAIWEYLVTGWDFGLPARGHALKRKKKDSVGAIGRNIGILLGNLVSLVARQGGGAVQVLRDLRRLSIWREVEAHYRSCGHTDQSLREKIEDSLRGRLLCSKWAPGH
jgi:hypothetical protein